MTNKEIKAEIAKKMIKEYGEIGAEITEFLDLETNSEYFHPIIKLKDDYYFYSQIDIRSTHAYAFCLFKHGDDMNYKIPCDTNFVMLKKIFENMEFYFPKIKYQYDKVIGFRKALEIVNKKLDKSFVDICKLEEDELNLNDYLEVQKLLKDIYEVG
jgi:hypothetical protein